MIVRQKKLRTFVNKLFSFNRVVRLNKKIQILCTDGSVFQKPLINYYITIKYSYNSTMFGNRCSQN